MVIHAALLWPEVNVNYFWQLALNCATYLLNIHQGKTLAGHWMKYGLEPFKTMKNSGLPKPGDVPLMS